jgi:sigma-B regulation protein RsbU (phosphoserine phosphatase)
MMLGAFKGAHFSACSLRLRQGQTLLLFTDGIVEARRGRDAFDIDSLASFAQQRAHLDPSELVEDLATLTTKLEPDDDVAVLALHANRRST